MENQHRLIKGYRDLSADEIALMNAIKAHAEETRALVQRVRGASCDMRWASIAETHLQQGYMALVRAVARPQGF